MKAMILAAGLGTRLQPFSLYRPKPLFPVLDRPLLLLTIERLKQAGFETIIVNTHHLDDQIRHALQNIKGIILQEENEILGTGGGLRQAVAHFRSEPILVVNGDIYHTVDYARIRRQHYNTGAQVTLVLHDYPRFNKVAVNEKSRIVDFGDKAGIKEAPFKRLAFTGIHVINPGILLQIPFGRYSSIIDCYRYWLNQNVAIHAEVVKNIFWTDIGSLPDYLYLHQGLLSGAIPSYHQLGFPSGPSPFYVAEHAVIGKDVQMKDWVCVGAHASIGDNTVLQRVVVWDGARVPAQSKLADTIAA